MNVVLLGADGRLARAVASAAPADVALHGRTKAELDITDPAAIDRALSDRPDWVINCAAWTRVDDAEEHEAAATAINGIAVGELGRVAARHGVRVLHISTEYVFDGQLKRPYCPNDTPRPLGAYGRSKLVGEQRLLALGDRPLVVRTQWLYGGGPSLVRTMWSRARAGQASRLVNDQWGAPTHVAEVAAVLWHLVSAGAEGVFHAAAGGYTTPYEMAARVYATVGADCGLVTPVSTAEYGAKAPRPANGRLDTTMIGGMRPWETVLAEALDPARCGATGP